MHVPILSTRQEVWADEAAVAASAARLAARSQVLDALLTLRGPLGAGKTTFARRLLAALGVTGPIKSPTYGLVETYTTPATTIHHCDFYRLDDPQEWEDAGIRDLLAGPGLKLIEWPEKAGSHLPAADLDILIEPLDTAQTEIDDNGDHQPRRVTWTARSCTGEALIT